LGGLTPETGAIDGQLMAVTAMEVERLVTAIHAAPPQVVIAFAGAGSQALAWLHSVGGSSRTVLEAIDCYSAASLNEWLGAQPPQFTSEAVARSMANRAYLRAGRLAGPGAPVAGVGCTATIATDRAKRGEHRAHIAVSDVAGVALYGLALLKGARDRRQEEELVSLLLLRAIAQAFGLPDWPPLPLLPPENVTVRFEPASMVERLLGGDFELVAVDAAGQSAPHRRWPEVALFSGSFNPLHEGHRQLAAVAAAKLGRTVHFELPLVNADKAPLSAAEAHRRVAQFAGFAPVFLTRAPLFSQKAKLFPRSVFVIGADTAVRLLEPRFYDDDPAQLRASLEEIRLAGCRFLVAGRRLGGEFVTVERLPIPAGYRDLFGAVAEAEFRVDVSSTELRAGGK
jgi:nicotinamide mononucleotide (NMN) deamidase PncC